MDYKQTLNYLYTMLPMFQKQGKSAFKKDLTNISELVAYLNHPHKNFKSIHIAGTNGKGSTSHILSAILQNAGYKVGLYTSPHYKDFRERIKINGEFITEQAVVDFVQQIQVWEKRIAPSFFEITVAMAFHYFSQEKVDIAIIETGLGGRLDSTNIIDPILSIITNISFDHLEMLGNTLPQIALEKAGIIKHNTAVLIGEKQPETTPVFEKKAKEQASPICYAEDVLSLKLVKQELALDHYQVESPFLPISTLQTDIKGSFQHKNLSTALAAVHLLKKMGYNINNQSIKEGCLNIRKLTRMIGRWEILQKECPLIIADSAHNIAGISQVLQHIKKLEFEQLHIVFGTVKDKKIDNILELLPKNATYYFVKANIARGMPTEQLKILAQHHQLEGDVYSSVVKGLTEAKMKANVNDLILIGGSIFVVAEIL